jgi:hypothetical protein
MTPSPVRRHLLAWTAMPFMGAANGVIRDLTYGRRMSRTQAHSLAVFPLALCISLYAGALARRWPLPDRRSAVGVGAAWLALTLIFETTLGAAQGRSRREILAQYDVLAGNLWPLVLAVVAAAPAIAHRRSPCS